jgi:hypothetical protein
MSSCTTPGTCRGKTSNYICQEPNLSTVRHASNMSEHNVPLKNENIVNTRLGIYKFQKGSAASLEETRTIGMDSHSGRQLLVLQTMTWTSVDMMSYGFQTMNQSFISYSPSIQMVIQSKIHEIIGEEFGNKIQLGSQELWSL